MGKLTTIIERTREMSVKALLDRYKHIVRAQAIREYIAAKEDIELTTEVQLVGDEIMRRMTSTKTYIALHKKRKNGQE